MKKILITGGLGYIGQELCYLYSGLTEQYKITVLDINFFSERVSRVKHWGFNFIQGDILDKNLMDEIIPEYDIIFHLAGITNVAYTKSEDNKLDDNITKTGTEGTRNILRNMNAEAKIIFPSTHVVFEGLDNVALNLDEEDKPMPVLTYSKSKYTSEKDIISSNNKYIILRLASVYGYSFDSMRIGIMPNLFTKMSSLNETIKLFSGGVQLKSLVSIKDVTSFMKFIAHEDIENELFHISSENLSVKDVADILREINPNQQIIETQDEIPNLGYTISNKKMLTTGFTIKNNLRDSLNDMFINWTKKRSSELDEYIAKGADIFQDDRGIISNYELSEPINLIGYIESKKGTVRANHYHPIQEQKCLLIKGKYISVTKNLYQENSKIETRLIKEGDLAVIKPNVAHSMVFIEDSIFLNLVNGERKHENYGITHTIPYKLVDEQLRKTLLEGYSVSCRVCGKTDFKEIISLGLSPLANNLESVPFSSDIYPLELCSCLSCGNFQLTYNINPDKVFPDYKYKSSVGKTFIDHFKAAANSYIGKFNLNQDSLIVDIGSNDGIALFPFVQNSYKKVIGIEPSSELCKISESKNIDTINSYFDSEVVDIILTKYGKCDLILASNVFAHINDLDNVFININKILKDSGNLIVEVQYQKRMFTDILFDNIYHEHYNYWTASNFQEFALRHDISLNHCEEINTHGGSIRLYFSKTKNQTKELVNFLEKESKEIDDDLINNFKNAVRRSKSFFHKNLINLKKDNNIIAGYGSPAKATTLLNFFDITGDDIDFIIEDNELKHDKYLPNTGIKIVPKSHLKSKPAKIIIVFAWNFFNEIVKNNKDLIESGVKFINVKDLMSSNFEA